MGAPHAMQHVDRSAGSWGSFTEGLDGALGVVGVMVPQRYRRVLATSWTRFRADIRPGAEIPTRGARSW